MEVFPVIGEALEDFLPLIAPGDDVIKGSLELNPGPSCHGIRILKLK